MIHLYRFSHVWVIFVFHENTNIVKQQQVPFCGKIYICILGRPNFAVCSAKPSNARYFACVFQQLASNGKGVVMKVKAKIQPPRLKGKKVSKHSAMHQMTNSHVSEHAASTKID